MVEYINFTGKIIAGIQVKQIMYTNPPGFKLNILICTKININLQCSDIKLNMNFIAMKYYTLIISIFPGYSSCEKENCYNFCHNRNPIRFITINN